MLCYVPSNNCRVTLQNKEELDSNTELDQIKKEENIVKNEETGVQALGRTGNLNTDNRNINEVTSEQESDLKPGQVKKPGTNNAKDLQQRRKPRMEVKDVPFHMVQLKPVERDPKATSPAPEKTDDGKVGGILKGPEQLSQLKLYIVHQSVFLECLHCLFKNI
jgi:hypothetical protein